MKHRVGLQAAIGGVALVVALVVLQPGVCWAAGPRLTRSTWGSAAATSAAAGGAVPTAGLAKATTVGAVAPTAVPRAAVAPKAVAAAVCSNPQLVTEFHFLINGTVTVATLNHNVHSGDTVQAFFTIDT